MEAMDRSAPVAADPPHSERSVSPVGSHDRALSGLGLRDFKRFQGLGCKSYKVQVRSFEQILGRFCAGFGAGFCFDLLDLHNLYLFGLEGLGLGFWFDSLGWVWGCYKRAFRGLRGF